MTKSYTIKRDVRGAIGPERFEYEAGTVTPKDEAERRVLDHLVMAGVASPKREKG